MCGTDSSNFARGKINETSSSVAPSTMRLNVSWLSRDVIAFFGAYKQVVQCLLYAQLAHRSRVDIAFSEDVSIPLSPLPVQHLDREPRQDL